MARKPISRSLPTLASLHRSFHRFDPRANQSAALLDLLRQTGATVRRERAAPFYPMRVVADFFGVSLGIVARAYERLEAEGLLIRVRGSQTWLQGRKPQPLHPVRGVVGLPVYLPAFLASPDWRALLVALETELRRRHFVADYIFYRAEQEPKPELAERILEHQLDAIIWYVPPPWVHMTLQRLSDAGVRLVLISDGRSQFRHPHYFVEIEHALGDALRQWRQEGIGALRVLHPIDTPLNQMIWLTSALQKVGVEYTLLGLRHEEFPAQARRLGQRRHEGVVFWNLAWYQSLCFQFPRAWAQLCQRCRVLLAHGAVGHPSFRHQRIEADIMRLNAAQAARRIAQDLRRPVAGTTEPLATFRLGWQPRVQLKEHVEDA